MADVAHRARVVEIFVFVRVDWSDVGASRKSLACYKFRMLA